jgi:hypothetical protein
MVNDDAEPREEDFVLSGPEDLELILNEHAN